MVHVLCTIYTYGVQEANCSRFVNIFSDSYTRNQACFDLKSFCMEYI